MRTLVLAFLALCACGGGSHHDDGPNAAEIALMGDYDLDGFEVKTDGVWYTQDDFMSWSGSLSLLTNLTYDFEQKVEDTESRAKGPWSADGATFSDGFTEVPYTLDGDVFTTHAVYPSGNEEIDHWRRVP